MRIIAGKYKGKKLNSFELSTTRPTSDMVRSSLFNILGDKIKDCTFLDLFAGTGACSIEAISRGAKFVNIVDSNKLSNKLINKNLSLINDNNYKVFNLDYLDFLTKCKKDNCKFDIIFIDPPYATNFGEIAVEFILSNNILNDDGTIVWEHDKTKLQLVENWKDVLVRTKKYGIKYLTVINIENE